MTTERRLTVAAAGATVLASVSLFPVFALQSWFWPAALAVVAVAVAGGLGRRLRLPRSLAVTGQAGALLLVLTPLYAHEVAVLGVVPGPGALRALRDLAADGLGDAERYTAPVPDTEGLSLLAVAGVGLVALVVDLVAVALRRATAAGLALLALYGVPASVVDGGVPAWGFAAVGLGYVTLLVAEGRDRLAQWGPAMGDQPAGRRAVRYDPDTHAVAQVGRRVGVAALGVAVLLPALLPSLGEGVLKTGGTGGDGGGAGGGSLTTSDPMVSMRRDLSRGRNIEVLRYRTDDPSPDYLRVATLDVFDGTVWKVSPRRLPRSQRVADGLPDPPGLAEGVDRTVVHTEFRVGDNLEGRWLPLPYPATEIDIDGDWRYDRESRNVLSTDDKVTEAEYDVTSLHVEPTAGQLDDASTPPEDLERYLRLPDDLPPSVARTARDVTADAKTPYRQAYALQRWFHSDEFRYSTEVKSGTSTSHLLDFLEEKVGYCEQYASTMAVMARSLGIPARVNVGYTAGSPEGQGWWSVRSHDAHAWPELYFSGVGWVRFEPTPRAAGGVAEPSYSDSAVPPPAPVADPEQADSGPTASPTGGITDAKRRLEGRTDPAGQAPDTGRAVSWTTVAIVVGTLALAAAPGALRVQQRRRRRSRAGADPSRRAVAAWEELRDAATDLGYHSRGPETPRQTATRLAEHGRLSAETTAALTRLRRGVEQARYAAVPPEGGEPWQDVAGVVGALTTEAGRGAHLRARLLPVSSLHRAQRAAGRAADAVEWLESFGGRARRRLERRAEG